MRCFRQTQIFHSKSAAAWPRNSSAPLNTENTSAWPPAGVAEPGRKQLGLAEGAVVSKVDFGQERTAPMLDGTEILSPHSAIGEVFFNALATRAAFFAL